MLKRLLFDNLFAKVLALLVSILLWVYVSEQQMFQETFSVPLRLENISDELTLVGDVPDRVEVLVQGQGRLLRHRVEGLYVAVDLSGATEGRYTRRFTPADVMIPPEETVEVLEIVSPGLLGVDLDRVLVKSVPVIPTTQHAPAAGYARVGSAVVNPERVSIRGAESVVSGVNSLRTEPVSLKGATRMVVARARVDLGGLERVRCEPEQVALALPVEKIETLTLAGVGVTAEVDTASWSVRWQPEEVEVVLRGAGSLLAGLRDASPVLRIDAGALEGGRYFFDLSLDRRERMTLVSREPEPVLSDSSDSTGVVGPPAPVETIELDVSLDLPEGVSATDLTPRRFHIVVEERGSRLLEEGGLILPPS